MLQIKSISKRYKTGDFVQQALDKVSLNLRDSEFVAILGPSGSGKTTLLNIIGGLDRYDDGDLVINGISTRQYKDRDWDSYRNHTIGFVFQSYNLIPHQTILSNVELALTISGIGKADRRERARKALEKVGLGEHINKKPNQLSGGQMQRVAIARALVNDPDIVLADEPTGALDSDTSVQIMNLLKDVAKDRLVVMVTHNPELAEQYATRIVNLRDGVIRSDTMPYEPEDEAAAAAPVHRNMGHSSMSLLTSLALSFNNLRTKKARTLLTAFAGSIGIIGIALIISLSQGVNDYIDDMERSTLSEYPLQILSSGVDITSFLSSGSSDGTTATGTCKLSDIASWTTGNAPDSITSENQNQFVTVTAETAPGYNTTVQARAVKKALDAFALTDEMPEGCSFSMGGESDSVNYMTDEMIQWMALALPFVYLVMVAQFQSLLSPFIVLFTVPLAFTGGLLGLLLTGQQLTMISMMGFIVLMGTVVNNGIVFVDYANQLRMGGMERRAALVATGKTRMRPILMTTLTTVLAMLQMVFSNDMASQLMSGMAIVIICGLSYATLMTLYIVPILYDILFKKPPLNVDIGSDEDLDDIPDDAAEFIAAQSSAAQPQPEA